MKAFPGRWGCWALGLAIMCGGAGTRVAVAEPCPLLWWHLDEAAGEVARDSHLRGDDGEPTGGNAGELHDADALVWLPDGGRIGGALAFPGDRGLVTADSFLTSGPEFTFSFWMRAAVLQDSRVADKFPDDDKGKGWAVSLARDGALRVLVGSRERFAEFRIAEAYEPGRWVQVTVAYAGLDKENPQRSILAVYLDGVERTGAARMVSADGEEMADPCRFGMGVEAANEEQDLRFGADGERENVFTGLLDEVRIYAEMLGSEEAAALVADPVPPSEIRLFPPSDPEAVLRINAADDDACDAVFYTLIDAPDGDPLEREAFSIWRDHLYFLGTIAVNPGDILRFWVRATDTFGLTRERLVAIEVVESEGSGGGNGTGFVFPKRVNNPGGSRAAATLWQLHFVGDYARAGALLASGVTREAPWSLYGGGFTHRLAPSDAGSGFEVTDTGEGRFEIRATEGIDLAEGSRYILRVRASDTGGFVASETEVTIVPVRLYLNEFMTDNETGITDEFLRVRDWMEVRNATGYPVSLDGWALTGSATVPDLWRFPAGYRLEEGEYRIVLASGRDGVFEGVFHTGFGIHKEECQYLALNFPERDHVATAYAPPRLGTDDAYGLVDDDPARRGHLIDPTPGATNTPPEDVVDKPKATVGRGIFTAGFAVSATVETEDAEVRFTMDGSIPTAASPVLVGSLVIERTTVLRLRGFRDDYLPGPTATYTYLFPEDVPEQAGMDPGLVAGTREEIVEGFAAIPAISLVAEPSAVAQLEVDLSAGRVSASMEFLSREGLVFQEDAALRLNGRRSREGAPKKSFRVEFRKEFGAAKLREPVFGPMLAPNFDSLVLRAGFNNSWLHPEAAQRARAQYVRDTFARETQRDMGHLAPHSRFVHLFVNGAYRGLYETVELPDDLFQSSYFGCEEEDFDTLDAGEARDGVDTQEDWDALVANARGGSLSDPARYEAFAAEVDLDDFIDFLILHAWLGSLEMDFLAGNDWASNNNWFAGRHHAGKWGWRFFTWDAERTLEAAGDNFLTLPNRSQLLIGLVRNPEFRLRFADRVQRHFFHGGVLEADAGVARYARLAAGVRPGIAGESARWGAVADPARPMTGADWEMEKARLLGNYLPGRSATVLAQLRLGGLLPGLDAPAFSTYGPVVPLGYALEMTTNAAGAQVFHTLDGSDPRMPGGGVATTALPYTGAVPLTGEKVTVSARTRLGSTWSPMETREFILGGVPVTRRNLAITEVMYARPGGDAAGHFLEFRNTGGQAVRLDGIALRAGANRLAPTGVVEAGAYFLFVRDPVAFAGRYGPGLPVIGAFDFPLSGDKGQARVTDRNGIEILDARYAEGIAGVGRTLFGRHSIVPAEGGAPNPMDPGYWRPSALPGGSPGETDPLPTMEPILISEVLARPPAGASDAVELFNPNPFDVDIGGWALSDEGGASRTLVLPAGIVIPALGYRVFYADDPSGGIPPGELFGKFFGFSSNGDSAVLAMPGDGGFFTPVDVRSFDASIGNLSFGLWTNSQDIVDWVVLSSVTLGSANASPHVPPLVVTEIMYHPEDEENGREFVELRNVSASAVSANVKLDDVYGDKFVDVTVSVPAGGFLVILPGVPALPESAGALDAFRAANNVPVGVPVVPGGGGTFPNSGGMVRIKVDRTTVETVRFTDDAPWPEAADGDGRSLERLDPLAYGNEPLNWSASCDVGGSPGRERPLTYAQWSARRFAGLAGAAEISAPGVDPNGNGLANLIDYALGNDPLASSPMEALPVAGIVPSENGGPSVFRLSFRVRAPLPPLLQLTVEESGDLALWRSATGLVLIAREDLGDGTERRVYERPLDGNEARMSAVRLRVTDFDRS